MRPPARLSGAELERWEHEERSRKAKRGWEGRRERGYEPRHPRRRHTPYRRDRREAIAHAYPIRRVAYEPFLELYYGYCYRVGIEGNKQGADSAWAQYQRRMRAMCVMGQGFGCTNERSAIAMDKAGRPRCERTTRRIDRKLEAMGLLRRVHVKRGRDREGERDYFAITMLNPPATLLGHRPGAGKFSQNVQRSYGEQQPRQGSAAAALDTAVCDGRKRRPPPPAAANGGDEGEQAEARLALPPAQAADGFKAELEQLADDVGGLEALNELLRAAHERESEP